MDFIWTRTRNKRSQIKSLDYSLQIYDEKGLVDFSKYPVPPNIDIYDEHGRQVNTTMMEYPEQCISNTYISREDTVLELGARYGSVSCIINKRLSDKTRQVSVEPDELVWKCLDDNIRRNDCSVHVHKGFVSKKKHSLTQYGYGSSSYETETSNIPSASVEDLEERYGIKFTALVADCEGFLGTFFEEHPNMYTQLTKVIFEADSPKTCNYGILRRNLKDNGFTEIIHGFQNVYIKY